MQEGWWMANRHLSSSSDVPCKGLPGCSEPQRLPRGSWKRWQVEPGIGVDEAHGENDHSAKRQELQRNHEILRKWRGVGNRPCFVPADACSRNGSWWALLQRGHGMLQGCREMATGVEFLGGHAADQPLWLQRCVGGHCKARRMATGHADLNENATDKGLGQCFILQFGHQFMRKVGQMASCTSFAESDAWRFTGSHSSDLQCRNQLHGEGFWMGTSCNNLQPDVLCTNRTGCH